MTSPSGWWGEFPKYVVSLLKAWFGDAATKENDWCYDYLPDAHGRPLTHEHRRRHGRRQVKGYFVMGENPVVGSMNGALQRKGLRQLDWLVVRDFQLIETAEFWRDAPEIERGEVRPEDIGTEVFFFPAARTPKKTAASPIRSGCCNGITRRSSRRAIAAANCDFIFTSASG